jgi:hypothetical protein
MGNVDAIRLLIRLACLAPMAGGLIAIDWMSYQPAIRRQFTRELDAAAEASVSGKTIWSHADMRDLKPVWLEHLSGRREVLVLGSSRMLPIASDWFQPRTALNAALFAGDFEDAVAMFQLCAETGKTPQSVVLDLNPTLAFEGKSRVAPALAPYYRRALMHYGIFPPTFFTGLLTMDGLRWDPRIFLNPPAWRMGDGPVADGYRMRPDGSADWGLTESSSTADDVEKSVVTTMHRLDSQYQHWRTTSQPGWFDARILRAFLDDLRARGIRVVVLFTPVHPGAFDFYARQGGYDETWIRREMAQRGVTVIGSYSPWIARAGKADFYDDVHVHAAVLHRLLREGGVVQ